MIRILSVASCLLFAILMLMLCQAEVESCAPVRRKDRPEDYIRIAEESAIIVWDPVKKVEHFIRRAKFDTKSPDFGFLVPTPALPILAKVEDRIFRDMEQWMLPKFVTKDQYSFKPMMCCMGCSKDSAPANARKDGVRVLAEQRLGGFDTAIVEADRTDALSDWLTKNGYSSDPELQSWLAPYVAAQWKITAFKIVQDPQTGELATTKPVRMSFAAERPFFPYREPESKPMTEAEKKSAQEKRDNAKDGHRPREFHFDEKGNRIWNDARMLRVHFVSTARMEGKLGIAAWHAKIPFADQLTDEQRQQIAKETGIAENDLPAQAWLTTFEDSAEPRPGKDEVYFDPAQDQTPVRPPDVVRFHEIWIPLDATFLAILFLVFLAYCVFRSLPKNRAEPRQ